MARKRWKVPDDLAEALRRVEEWRRTRPKRGPMPEELWAEAIGLVEAHGAWRVKSVLRLNYDCLKKRLERLRHDGGSAPAQAQRAAFVELRAPQVGVKGEVTGAVVALSGADGSKLEIRLPDSAGLDVPGLFEAFWRRGA